MNQKIIDNAEKRLVKTVRCAGCLGETDRRVCNALPPCAGVNGRGENVKWIFVAKEVQS